MQCPVAANTSSTQFLHRRLSAHCRRGNGKIISQRIN
ncbi:rCG19985 [Rattus norvegicus]|uniref:RCG19985 n=1 Tax=Rattus norvegicus TaxID=10116 RepID=A6KIF9_RAT|nr:rCG19985 [Rattus norvegicus]